jgi:CDP-diacylglycerol--serine O-phosphatidyltransferase
MWLGALQIGPFTLHPFSVFYVISGALMVSTFKIPKP